jgi:hypothetical protein
MRDREQTATLQTVLLHRARDAPIDADPDANRSAGPRSYCVVVAIARHEGLVELARHLLSRKPIRPGLELWRTREADGRGPGVWYVTPGTSPVDSGPAVLSCREEDPATDRCTYSFLFRPGISGDIRFRAKHAVDWPEIHCEAHRVLEQLKSEESMSMTPTAVSASTRSKDHRRTGSERFLRSTRSAGSLAEGLPAFLSHLQNLGLSVHTV